MSLKPKCVDFAKTSAPIINAVEKVMHPGVATLQFMCANSQRVHAYPLLPSYEGPHFQAGLAVHFPRYLLYSTPHPMYAFSPLLMVLIPALSVVQCQA